MSVTITTLDSGLKVVTDTIESVETLSCGAWFRVGTRNETHDINGVSHFLEHMAFKGTNRRTALQIAEEIESAGGYLNAYTGREITAYYARTLKNDLPLAIDILGDILQHSTFDPVEFEREQGVIIQEIGQSNDTPDDVVFDYFQETCYPQQSMGWPTLGTESLVRSMTPEIISSYMKNHYSLANMVFSAAGNIKHDDVVKYVEQHFSTMQKNISLTVTPAQYQGGQFKLEKNLEQAHIIYGFEGVPFGHEDYYPTMIYSMMMGGGMSSRLFQEVREKRGLVYTIHTSTATYSDTGLFYIYAGTGGDDLSELVPVVMGELSKSTDGFSNMEIMRAKAQLKAGLMMGLESTSNRCERLANQILIHGRTMTATEICEKIDAVTNTDIIRAAQRLIASNPTLTAYGPIAKLPEFKL